MPDLTTPLPCRRPELVSRSFGESGSYLVRNRLQGESFRVGPEEHFLLARLDGTRTAADVCGAFAERFGEPLTEEDLQEFLELARERGFLQPDGAADPVPLRANAFPEDPPPRPPGRGPAVRRRRFAARLLGWAAAGLQGLGDFLNAAGRRLQWARLTRCEFVPRPDDIFLVTYSRSGTTWMQMILYQLTTDGSMDFPHIYEFCPWFEASLRSASGFEGRPSPRLFKSHLPYHRIPKGPGKYIYVARNGKDVAVSFFHHYRTHNGYQGTFAEFFDQFMAGKVAPGSWFEHVKGWWRHRHDPNVLFLRYEDLVGDLEGSVRRIIAFCGFDIAPERFPTILERCGFAFMKRHESQFDPVLGTLWEQGVQLNAFIRKGRTGDWKDTLSPEQAARFDKAFHEQLGPTGIHFGPEDGMPRLQIDRPTQSATGNRQPAIPSDPLETLAAQVHGQGGWGYTAGQPAQPEPTCLALLALSLQAERFGALLEGGLAFLGRCAAPDGSYRPVGGPEQAVWPTALALLVQSALGRPVSEGRRTASALLEWRGQAPPDPEAPEVHDLDIRLTGWPWTEGTFSWVEPTAWACLALRHAGHGGHPRVEEGLRLLLDRAHDEGGLNFGSRRVLGSHTQPTPGPTAIALLALQGYGGESRVAAAVAYLLRQARGLSDLELLCWAKLALDLHRNQPGVPEILPQLDERIVAARARRAEAPWAPAAPVCEALTALALGTRQGNVFRVSSEMPAGRSAYSVLSTRPSLRPRSPGRRVRSGLSGLAVRAVAALRPLPAPSAVHIGSAADYNADLAALLRRQYAAFKPKVPLAGKRVVLKPNLVEYHPDKVINTHPHVVAAAIELCRREGAAEVIVAEGPGHWRNVEYLVSASGLGDVLRHYRVPFVDLNHDEPVKMLNRGRLTGLEYLYLAKTVATAEVLISLPKLKTHHWAGATLALKNLFGTLPGICYGWPKNELHWRGIDHSIVDIALTRTPELAIVDGIVGMEGDGPLNGSPRPMGVLVMGGDPLATDATCCRLMQLDPEKIAYLVLGHRRRLGHLHAARIEQIGEAIEALAQPFETAPHFHQVCVGWDHLNGDADGRERGLRTRTSCRDGCG
jgi:uncharacterized protein (DUF362 family)